MSTITAELGSNDVAPLIEDEPGFFEELLEKVPRIQAEMAHLDEQKHNLDVAYNRQVDLITGKKRKLQSLLKALGHDEPVRRRTRRQKTLVVSSRVLTPVIDEILTRPDDDVFSITDIHLGIAPPWTEGYTSQALLYLRQVEFIGLAAHRGPQNRMLFRMLPGAREMADNLKAELGNRVADAKYHPTDENLTRVVTAIKATNPQHFTTLEVAERLGARSPKGTYSVMRFMMAKGMVESIGRTQGQNGARARVTYRLVKETPDA